MALINPAAESVPTPQTTAQRKTALASNVAEKFEGLLLQQLVKILRQTSPMMGSGGHSSKYIGMFDAAFADQLAQSGGIGLASMIRPLVGESKQLSVRHVSTPSTYESMAYRSVSGAPSRGLTRMLQTTAQEMIHSGAERWAKEGKLQSTDILNDVSMINTRNQSNRTGFNRSGYQGYYKCNLFAFELARRAGFAVPIVERGTTLGYPGTDRVTNDAASDKRLKGNWADVVTGERAGPINQSIERGESAYMLTGSGRGDRSGHMAVIERLRDIEYGKNGEIRRVVFDGWEAREKGAQHLTRRTWNRYGNPGGHLQRTGFDRIEILKLRRAENSAQNDTKGSVQNRGSFFQKTFSSSLPNHPTK